MHDDRTAAIRRIDVGDIFHATAPNGASFPCLALQIRQNTIFARRMTTQSVHEFDRSTGLEEANGVPVIIDSVEPLPNDIRDTMLALDRKYRESEERQAENPDWESSPEESALSMEQKWALLFMGIHYPAHLLQSGVATGSMARRNLDDMTTDEKIDLLLSHYLIPDNLPE